MKRIIILSMIVIGLSSCEKKSCYRCTKKHKDAALYNLPFTTTDAGEHCGWTESDKDSYVKANSYQGSSTIGYPSITIMSCNLK